MFSLSPPLKLTVRHFHTMPHGRITLADFQEEINLQKNMTGGRSLWHSFAKEGRKFTQPWQPTRLNGWKSVCLSSDNFANLQVAHEDKAAIIAERFFGNWLQVSWLGLCGPETSPWSASTSLLASIECHADDRQMLFHPFSLVGCQGMSEFPAFFPSLESGWEAMANRRLALVPHTTISSFQQAGPRRPHAVILCSQWPHHQHPQTRACCLW